MAFEGIADDLKDSVVRRISRVSAKEVIPLLPEGVRDFLRQHTELLRLSGDIARLPISNLGFPLLNVFVHDFPEELAVELEKLDHTHPPQTTTPATPTAQQTAQQITDAVTVMQAVSGLDATTRNRFFSWWTSNEEREKGFLKLVAGETKEEIKTRAALPTHELDFQINRLPKERKHMNYLELRAAITADADAPQMVNEFLTNLATARGGTDQTLIFWKAVQRAVESGRINSLDQFKQLMSFSEPEIIEMLGLHGPTSLPTTVTELPARIDAAVTDAGIPTLARNFYDWAKAWAER